MPEEAEAHVIHVIHVGFYLNDMIFDCCKTYVLKLYHKMVCLQLWSLLRGVVVLVHLD